MTRARKTLTLARFAESGQGALAALGRSVSQRPAHSASHSVLEVRDRQAGMMATAAQIPDLRGHSSVLHRPPTAQQPVPAELEFRHETLPLKHIDLGFPGRRTSGNPIHRAIRQLVAGDELGVRTGANPWEITTRQGQVVGRLARQFQPSGRFRSARVHAIVGWRREDSTPEYQDGLRCDEWEVVVPELIFS